MAAAGAGLILWTMLQPSVTTTTRQSTAPAARPSGPSLKQLVDAGVAEGEVQLSWSPGLDDGWRQTFEVAFNRQFGFKLALRMTSGGPPAGTGQPAGDLLLGTQAQVAEVVRARPLARQEWSKLFGAPAQAVLFDAGAAAFAQQVVSPAYSTRQVTAASAPASWESLLEPRWKGRIGVSSAVDVWAELSSSWGDERTTQLVQDLAAQQPVRGTPAELEHKLQDGAIDILAALDDRQLRAARDRAAPVAGISPQPLLLQSLVAAPLPSAAHPNAAVLFAGFLLTEEGQQLWQQYAGQSSIYTAGSPAQQLILTRPYVLAGTEFSLREQAARAAKYARILGY